MQAKQEEAQLRSEILNRVRVAFPESEITDEKVTQVIDDFVLPPLRALGRLGVIKLDADDSSGDATPSRGPEDSDVVHH